jgi:hypothetical protein
MNQTLELLSAALGVGMLLTLAFAAPFFVL